MSQIKAFQIDRLIDGLVRINGLSVSGGNTNVTTVITTALSTAGDGGSSVPLQVATSTTVGIITTGNNQIPLVNGTTKKPIKDTNDNEVYGRLTESSGTYTLTYYSLNASGVETAYSFSSGTIDFWFSYRYDFGRLPKDFAVRYTVTDVNEILQSASVGTTQNTFTELLTVSGTNTVSNLTKTPTSGSAVTLFVNGVAYFATASEFSVSSKTITWNATNAKYSIVTGDVVVAQYETLE